MALTQTQTVKTEECVELTTEQRAQLLREFTLYEQLSEQLADTARDVATSKSILVGIREELGVKSVGFDGYHTTLVDGGTSKSLNKKKLYALGITAKQLEACYERKPKKSHELVTTPRGEKRAAAAKAAKAAMPRDERDDYDERDE